MRTNRFVSFAFVGLLAFSFTGCVGNCLRPTGCSSCGPVSMNCGQCDSCDGCGELYIDPWVNDPADCCDPCDSCGNYNGQSCGKCRPVLSGQATLWGYRCGPEESSGCGCGAAHGGCGCGAEPCDGGGCSCGAEAYGGGCSCGAEVYGGHVSASPSGHSGCSSCNGGLSSVAAPHQQQVIVMEDGRRVMGTVTESIKPAYRPERTRKIFRPKAHIASEVGNAH